MAETMTMKSRIILATGGFIVLFVGIALYLVDRPPEDTYFVYRSLEWLSFHGTVPAFFGAVGNILPGFVHPFAFSLMTAGVANTGRRGVALICLFWFVVNALFELGQKYKQFAASLVPDWLEGVPYLENTVGFFLRGTFDWWDIAAIAAGSCLAFIIIFLFLKEERENRPTA